MTPPPYVYHHVRRSYLERRYLATPGWGREERLAVYREAARRRRRGEDVVVDHVLPLNGATVCGLHVAENLEIVPAQYNRTKSDRYGQRDLFHPWAVEPHQPELL